MEDKDPFVKSEFQFAINEEIENLYPYGIVQRKSPTYYEWKLSEISLFIMAGMIHSLRYANPELHLDDDLKKDDISVYCVVE